MGVSRQVDMARTSREQSPESRFQPNPSRLTNRKEFHPIGCKPLSIYASIKKELPSDGDQGAAT